MLDCGVRIDDQENWVDGAGGAGTIDFLSVMTHEEGHTNSVSHSTVGETTGTAADEATMSPFVFGNNTDYRRGRSVSGTGSRSPRLPSSPSGTSCPSLSQPSKPRRRRSGTTPTVLTASWITMHWRARNSTTSTATRFQATSQSANGGDYRLVASTASCRCYAACFISLKSGARSRRCSRK